MLGSHHCGKTRGGRICTCTGLAARTVLSRPCLLFQPCPGKKLPSPGIAPGPTPSGGVCSLMAYEGSKRERHTRVSRASSRWKRGVLRLNKWLMESARWYRVAVTLRLLRRVGATFCFLTNPALGREKWEDVLRRLKFCSGRICTDIPRRMKPLLCVELRSGRKWGDQRVLPRAGRFTTCSAAVTP